jgi:hypothetical protein
LRELAPITHEFSPRTRHTFWRALGLAVYVGGRDAMVDIINQASRPNDSLNVTKMHRLALELVRNTPEDKWAVPVPKGDS